MDDSIENQILALIEQYERATGRRIDGVEIMSVDVTGIEDAAPRYVRNVVLVELDARAIRA